MLDFISRAFKGLFSFIIWVSLILVGIGGFLFIQKILIAFLIWGIGLILIILSAGIVSIFIKINENIENIDENIQMIMKKMGVKETDFYENENIHKKYKNINTIKDNVQKTEEKIKIILKNIDTDINLNDLKTNIFNNKNILHTIYEILITKGNIEMNQKIKHIIIMSKITNESE